MATHAELQKAEQDRRARAGEIADRYAEILAPVEERDRLDLRVYANGNMNMTGGRYSDALRSEVRAYVSMGRDRYLETERKARENSSFYGGRR